MRSLLRHFLQLATFHLSLSFCSTVLSSLPLHGGDLGLPGYRPGHHGCCAAGRSPWQRRGQRCGGCHCFWPSPLCTTPSTLTVGIGTVCSHGRAQSPLPWGCRKHPVEGTRGKGTRRRPARPLLRSTTHPPHSVPAWTGVRRARFHPAPCPWGDQHQPNAPANPASRRESCRWRPLCQACCSRALAGIGAAHSADATRHP